MLSLQNCNKEVATNKNMIQCSLVQNMEITFTFSQRIDIIPTSQIVYMNIHCEQNFLHLLQHYNQPSYNVILQQPTLPKTKDICQFSL